MMHGQANIKSAKFLTHSKQQNNHAFIVYCTFMLSCRFQSSVYEANVILGSTLCYQAIHGAPKVINDVAFKVHGNFHLIYN